MAMFIISSFKLLYIFFFDVIKKIHTGKRGLLNPLCRVREAKKLNAGKSIDEDFRRSNYRIFFFFCLPSQRYADYRYNSG